MDGNILEILKERREANKSDGTTQKDLNWVPYDVYSFGQFEVVDRLDDIRQEYTKVFNIFVQIADNIMYNRPDGFADRLIQLTSDFTKKILEIKLQEGEILKSGSVALFKSHGELQWIGVPTNKFQDREKDILSDVAHRKFVKMLKDGTAEMPKLFPWHTGEIGKATWVDYDERGFLIAGGTINKAYEDYVINLVGNTTEPLGMSHGMYNKDIVRDSANPNVIIEYKSFEFSFLPQSYAANLLTSFTTN